MAGSTIRAFTTLLCLAATMGVPRLHPVTFAEAASPSNKPVPFEGTRDAVLKAAQAEDWARVEAFLASVKSDSEPAAHLLAGDLLFAMGRPEAAYPEHQAAAKEPVESQARFEAALDLLASRRFADACASPRSPVRSCATRARQRSMPT